MPHIGKSLRLRRILARSGKTVIVPMDHGVSDGPIAGVATPAKTVEWVREGGANAIVLHKGLVPAVEPELGPLGLLVHLSASTSLNPDPNDKRLVGTVEEVARLGADGVSVHVNVGAPTESRMIEDLGRIAERCDAMGLPLLAMMYPRGHEIHDPHDLRYVAHVARLGAELGADIIKVPYTGSPGSFREVVRSCPQPIVVSGGPRATTDREVLEMVRGTMDAGAVGVSIGRNIWQHSNPVAMAHAVADIVLRDADVESAMSTLKSNADAGSRAKSQGRAER